MKFIFNISLIFVFVFFFITSPALAVEDTRIEVFTYLHYYNGEYQGNGEEATSLGIFSYALCNIKCNDVAYQKISDENGFCSFTLSKALCDVGDTLEVDNVCVSNPHNTSASANFYCAYAKDTISYQITNNWVRVLALPLKNEFSYSSPQLLDSRIWGVQNIPVPNDPVVPEFSLFTSLVSTLTSFGGFMWIRRKI